MQTIQQLAEQYSELMVIKQRPNGERFICLRDDVQENHPLYKIIKLAHGDFMPDDYIYDYVRDALTIISENDDLDNIQIEADIYNKDLLKWLSSHDERVERCNDVMQGVDSFDMMNIIQSAQWQERDEIFHFIRQELENIIEEN